MLWKIYKNDPEVCHYIFGTMHTATTEAYTFAELAKKYIVKTAQYAAEMDLNQALDYNLNDHYLLKDGVKFSSLFRPKQYQKFRKIINKSLALDLDHFENYTPFYITNFMVNLVLSKDHPLPLDHYLWDYARSSGKDLTGIESVSDQVKILENIPLNYQTKVFKDHMKNIHTMKKKVMNLNTMYERCDLKSLMNATKKSMGSIRKLMIYDRNVAMANKIMTFCDDKPTFIAVGIAHLPGKKGILSLLKQEGYKIKKVQH